MPSSGAGSRRVLWISSVAGFAALLVAAIVFDLAGVPAPPRAPSPGQSTYPANPHHLVTNNLKIGDALRLNLHTLPQTAHWLLASSNSGPSYIGPYFVDLGPDWFVLNGPVLMGGGANAETIVGVPYVPALVGLEFVLQCAVVSPLASDVIFSSSVTLRVSQGVSKNILILRQTANVAGMTTAAQQAAALALSLQLLGNQVTVADDALPTSLLDYDCILDLRFATPPAFDEDVRFVQFLKQNGGLFFVCGPYAGCPLGQQRAAWISTFMNATLGLGVAASSGGSLSNGSVESIDGSLDPAFLNTPLSIAGLPFNVSNEGGNFGPPGAAPTGMPWMTGATIFGPLVFGMIFEPAAMQNQTVGGRVAVLFSGGADTFEASAQSPFPELVMCNLAWYLDR
jgi:hypothetical protein